MTSVTFANPVFQNVEAGSATVQQTSSSTVVNQNSQQAIINWQSFNISAAEQVHFQQPVNGVALNRINPNMGASQIFGQLSATGEIILVNQAGIYFGPGARVDVGSIIATTRDISNANFLAGQYVFDQPSQFNGSVINQGMIISAEHGLVALIGSAVRNDGTITAQLGSIVLASGSKFTFDFNGDQLVNFTVDEAAAAAGIDPNGTVLKYGVKNTGSLIADGGTINVSADVAQNVLDHAINMEGVVQAESVSQQNGTIILDANDGKVSVAANIDVSGKNVDEQGGTVKILGEKVDVKNPTVIDASGYSGGGEVLIGGDHQGKGPEQNAYSTYVDKGVQINADATYAGNGGDVVVWADHDTHFYGSVTARGGLFGGDGGSVETSGEKQLYIKGMSIDLSAPEGNVGTWLIDPENVTIADNGGSNVNESFGNGTYTPSGDDAIVDVSDLESALAGPANIIVTTGGTGSLGSQSGDITVANSLSWTSNNTLTLSAYRDITINSGVTISNNSASGGLTLQANNSGAFSGASGHGVVNQNGTLDINSSSNVKIYYNTPDYTTPTTYTNTGTAPVVAYMLVNDVNDLQNINNNLSGNYALSKDIDASATLTWNAGQGFLPLGGDVDFFTGDFDGQNHVINSLYMNQVASDGGSLQNVGLFSDLIGNIENVGLTNVNINYSLDDANAGAVAGYFAGTMNNVFSTGIVQGVGFDNQVIVGGLVGTSDGSVITNSYSTAAVFASVSSSAPTPSNITFDVGGLIGRTIDNSSVSHSFSAGSVTVNTSAGTPAAISVGGFQGLDDGTTTFSNNFWNTETSGQMSSPGATGLTTAQMMMQSTFSGAGWDFGTQWANIEGTSYPYLKSFYISTPRVVSGTANNSPLGSLEILQNGASLSAEYVGANGFFYDLFGNGTIADGTAVLTAVTSGDKSNVVAVAGNGGASITNLVLDSNTLTLGDTSSSVLSNSALAQAAGNLPSTDSNILYSASGSDLTLGNATSGDVTLTSTAQTTYNVDGNVNEFSGVSTNYLFNGAVNTTATNTLTTTGSQIYNGAVTLGAATSFTSNAGNITLNNTLSGGSQALTLTGGAGADHVFTLNDITSLATLTVNGNAAVNNTLALLMSSGTTNWTVTNNGGTGGSNGIVTATSITNGTFNNLQNLTGGAAANNFIFNSNAAINGNIAGGSGTNTLTVNGTNTSWIVNGANAGTVTGVMNGFSNIGSLIGGAGTNTFAFTGSGSITGQINGGNTTNINTLDFSGYSQPVALALSVPTSGNEFNAGSVTNNASSNIVSFTQIQQAIGTSAGQSTLTLPNKANISVTYTNAAKTSGSIADPFNFTNFTITNAPISSPPPALPPNIAQIITPFTTDPNTPDPGVSTPLTSVDQSINQILNQQSMLDDAQSETLAVGCFQLQ